MKKTIILITLLFITGCTSQKQDIGLEVPFHSNGCAGFDESNSEITIINDGLRVVSNVLSDKPCYKLIKAEISRVEDNVTVYFTFKEDEEAGPCQKCIGAQTIIYKIFGSNLNRTGININEISYFEDKEVNRTLKS